MVLKYISEVVGFFNVFWDLKLCSWLVKGAYDYFYNWNFILHLPQNYTIAIVCMLSILHSKVHVTLFSAIQVLESYERAYSNMVRVQQLSELEEVISDLSASIFLDKLLINEWSEWNTAFVLLTGYWLLYPSSWECCCWW